MNPERWQQIDQLLQSALGREPGQRSAFLAHACAGDEPLRWEVESLIASHEKVGNILEKPLSEVAAKLFIDGEARLAEGQSIGRYQVKALLGEGGMGEVYLVQDTVLGRQVALKLLPAQFTRDTDRLHRFEQEARAASALNHPNIITIHEIGQLDGAHFIVTEFIEGQTLRQQMVETRVSLRDVLDVTSQVASALEAAHAAGIVHRDIKPENIMRRQDGFIKVLDFGLAKLTLAAPVESDPKKSLVNTNPGIVFGTVRYMSPEQARGGQELDARTDIWSLGVVLYEMITGRPPFDGETPSHVIVSILQDDFGPLEPSAPELPVELERIVSKALQKDREKRYQTAKELAIDLLSLKQELEVDARLERSIRSAESEGDAAATKKVRHVAVVTPNKSASAIIAVGTERPTSSVEYVINEIKRHKRSAILVASTMALALATYAYFFYFAKPGEAIESVAVFPLLNVNADSNTEYLSDGISESIVNSLTTLPNLNVKSLSSVLRYKGRQIDPQTAGHELGVSAVVMGRLFQHDDELTINIELVDVRDNRRLWGKQYDRKVADVLATEKEIAQEIAEKLRPKLSVEERPTKNYTDNNKAYQEFLKGRHHFNKRTADELILAGEFFQQAIDLDRNYSLAYAGLALSFATLGRRGALLPIEAYPRASAAASRALEIDYTLADAHNAQGMVKMDFARDFGGAEKEFKRAIDLDPLNIDARHAYSHFLVAVGRYEESLAESRRVLEIDPLNLLMNSHLAWHYLFSRNYDEAIKQGRQTLDMGEDYWAHFYLGQAYEQTKRYDEAIAEFKKAINMSPTSAEATAALGYAYAISGRNVEAKRLITELNESAKHRYVSLGYQALIYTGLGEKEQALKWLQEAYEERAGWLVYLNVDPRYDSLRSDPRFKELLQRMKLVRA
jgi:serine/threonine-protein kinase